MGEDPQIEQKKALARMPLEHLQQRKQMIEGEIEAIMSSHMQMRTALNRYSNSKETIRQFSKLEPGTRDGKSALGCARHGRVCDPGGWRSGVRFLIRGCIPLVCPVRA